MIPSPVAQLQNRSRTRCQRWIATLKRSDWSRLFDMVLRSSIPCSTPIGLPLGHFFQVTPKFCPSLVTLQSWSISRNPHFSIFSRCASSLPVHSYMVLHSTMVLALMWAILCHSCISLLSPGERSHTPKFFDFLKFFVIGHFPWKPATFNVAM